MNAKKLFKALLCGALAIAVMLVALTGCSLVEQILPGSGNENTDSAKTLVSITLESMPTKLDYEIGETVDTTGMKVIANFSDGSKEDVTDKCTTTIGSDKITATTTSYYVKYVYEKTTKTVRVDINVNKIDIEFTELTAEAYENYVAPHKIAESSEADYVFVTSFNSSSMLVDACLELFGTEASGTFKYSERNDKPEDINWEAGMGYKIGYMQGTYSSSDGEMTLKIEKVQRIATARLDSVTVEVAKIIKDEAGNIVGLQFGSMVKPNLVFGWGKSKAADFVEGNAQNYDLPADVCYFSILENGKVPSNLHVYHAEVESISIASLPNKLSYEYGEMISLAGLTINVNYEAGAPRLVESGFTADKVEPLVTSDTLVTVSYDGMTATYEITVGEAPLTGLQAIELNNYPTELKYVYAGTTTLAEALKASGMTLTAKYADKEDATITEFDIENGDAVINGELTSYTVSYTEDGVTKALTVEITTAIMTPAEIAKTSAADHVFYTYFTKDKNVCNGTLELYTATGTFTYTAQMGSSKYNVSQGKYAIVDGVISFTEIELTNVMGSSGMTTNADETATVVYDGDKIIGLDFGCLAGDVEGVEQAGFWGYTASKQSGCKSSAAETVSKPAYMMYMVCIENGDIGTLRVDY
ncbi:MAG: bacterial Ig-like domain-containing protein [Clostridia bacterium]|nr:bacterial Ig-like domain-containing protein [Clostridia bacterium]